MISFQPGQEVEVAASREFGYPTGWRSANIIAVHPPVLGLHGGLVTVQIQKTGGRKRWWTGELDMVRRCPCGKVA